MCKVPVARVNAQHDRAPKKGGHKGKGPGMSNILIAMLPIYVIVALGYLCARTGFLPAALLTQMGQVVVKICLPVLVLLAIARSRPGALDEGFMLAYAAASVATLLIGLVFARLALRTPAAEGWILGWGMSNSNSGFLGLPLGLALFGPDAALVFAMTMIVENVLIIPLALVGAGLSTAQGGRAALARVLRLLVANPLLLAILAALAVRSVGLELPAPVLQAMAYLADAAPAVALLVIGGILAGLSMRGYWRRVGAVAVGKLALHPALVFVAFALTPGISPQYVTIGMLFAAAPMLTVYPLFAQAYGLEKVASAALLVTTLLGAGSLAVVLMLVGA